jgi:hypothetical protein
MRGKWQAIIGHSGKTHHIGYFTNQEEAARVYGSAARMMHHGKSAKLNFPGAEEQQGAANEKASKQSKHRGVRWDKDGSKWRASIGHSGKEGPLPWVLYQDEAARAYGSAARVHHGKSAKLNFPGTDEQQGAAKDEEPSKQSKHRGTTCDKKHSKWRAEIHHSGKNHHLGYFTNQDEVAREDDSAARVHGAPRQEREAQHSCCRSRCQYSSRSRIRSNTRSATRIASTSTSVGVASMKVLLALPRGHCTKVQRVENCHL